MPCKSSGGGGDVYMHGWVGGGGAKCCQVDALARQMATPGEHAIWGGMQRMLHCMPPVAEFACKQLRGPDLRARTCRNTRGGEDGIWWQHEKSMVVVTVTAMVVVVVEGRSGIFGSSRAPPARALPLNWARCVILADKGKFTQRRSGSHWPCTRIATPCILAPDA